MFIQWDDTAQGIMNDFERFLVELEDDYEISFKDPPHDISRRFLYEIQEFNQIGE